jgi:hypothetical protein
MGLLLLSITTTRTMLEKDIVGGIGSRRFYFLTAKAIVVQRVVIRREHHVVVTFLSFQGFAEHIHDIFTPLIANTVVMVMIGVALLPQHLFLAHSELVFRKVEGQDALIFLPLVLFIHVVIRDNKLFQVFCCRIVAPLHLKHEELLQGLRHREIEQAGWPFVITAKLVNHTLIPTREADHVIGIGDARFRLLHLLVITLFEIELLDSLVYWERGQKCANLERRPARLVHG